MRADVLPTRPELSPRGHCGSPVAGESLSSQNKVLARSPFPVHLRWPMLCSKDVALTQNKSVFREDTRPESRPAEACEMAQDLN